MPVNKFPLTPDQFAVYQVKIQGALDPNWIRQYQGITIDFDGETTTLSGITADQSSLRGLLCYLWDFNLSILSVTLIDSEGVETGCLPERKS